MSKRKLNTGVEIGIIIWYEVMGVSSLVFVIRGRMRDMSSFSIFKLGSAINIKFLKLGCLEIGFPSIDKFSRFYSIDS